MSPRVKSSLRPLVLAALLGQVAISAGTYLAAKRGMQEVSPFTLVMWRFLLSGLAYAMLIAVLPRDRLPPKGSRARVLWLGLLAGPINQGLFFSGLYLSSSAHAALLYALTPMGVYLLSLATGRERAHRFALFGMAVALSGVAVLLFGKGLADASGSLIGDLLILFAVASWVLYTTELKPLASRFGPIRVTAWTMGAAALLSLPALPFVLQPVQVFQGSAALLGSIVYLGLLTSVVAYFLWSYALSHAPASKVAVFANLQPPATAIAAWLLLDEPITLSLVIGGVMVMLGVRITQRAKVEKPAPAPR